MSEQFPQPGDTSFEAYAYRAFIAPDGRLRSIWRFFLAVIVAFLGNMVAGVFAVAIARGRVLELIYRPLALVVIVFGFCLLLKLADGVNRDPLSAMGLSFRKPWIRDSLIGLLIGFTLIFAAYLVIRFTCDLTVNITVNRRTELLVIFELFVLAAAAMLEEVMFRGYPFQRLVESFSGAARWLTRDGVTNVSTETAEKSGSLIAAIFWSSVFGALHFGNPQASIWSFLNTSFIGVLFCLAYLRTRSLWMPWGIHFAWNTTLGVVFGLPVSGLMSFAVMVRSKAVGPLWVTGGGYGIEASALGTAVIVLGIVIVLVFVKPRTTTPVTQPQISADNLSILGGDSPERIQM